MCGLCFSFDIDGDEDLFGRCRRCGTLRRRRRSPPWLAASLVVLLGLALSIAAPADTVLQYTVPAREAPWNCDSVFVTPAGDTLRHHGQETMGTTRLWWWPRWAAAPYLMRQKNVAGREGQTDTLRVPADTVATVYLTFRDAAGNGTDDCRSNYVTVNLPPVGVEGFLPMPTELRWYDITGRRLAELDGLTIKQVRLRVRSGVYLQRETVNGVARPAKVVVVR